MAINIQLSIGKVDHGAGLLFHVRSALISDKGQMITATARTLDEAIKHIISIWVEHSDHFSLDTEETAIKQDEAWLSHKLPLGMTYNEYIYGLKFS